MAKERNDDENIDKEDINISPLREAALQMHEMYSELTRAGFTRKQAVSIVAHILATGVTEGVQEFGGPDGQEDLD